MKLLDGKELAREILNETTAIVAKSQQKNGITATLGIVVATKDESADWYVRSIAKKAKKTGITCQISSLSDNASQSEIADELARLANDINTHGIILQTPLPESTNIDSLLELIPAEKDIDGANPLSMGRLVNGMEAFAPATAEAVMALLSSHEIGLEGKRAVVIGRSRIVGKPVAHLLLDQNATITICHSRTKDLPDIARQADVLVVAIGKAKFVTDAFIGENAIVIDVGTNVDNDGNLLGDVDSESVESTTGALSPVPGGVGPVTTAILLKHTAEAAAKQQ